MCHIEENCKQYQLKLAKCNSEDNVVNAESSFFQNFGINTFKEI